MSGEQEPVSDGTHLPLLHGAAVAQRQLLELRPVPVHEALELADLVVVQRGHLVLGLRVARVVVNREPNKGEEVRALVWTWVWILV